jgi:hypothetical protein
LTTISPAAFSAVDLSTMRSLLPNSFTISLLGPGELILIRDVNADEDGDWTLEGARSWCHIRFGAMP